VHQLSMNESNASDHLPAGALPRAIRRVHTRKERVRCIASLGETEANTTFIAIKYDLML